MCIVLVFGVSAQVVVTITRDGLIGRQVGVPGAIFGIPDWAQRLLAEVVGGSIALRIVVTILITELEIHLTEDGLAIGDAGTVVPVLRGGVVIATGDISGVVCQLIEIHQCIVDRLTAAFAPVSIELNGDVTALGVEFAIELQHTAQVLRVAVTDVVLHAVVLHDAEGQEFRELLQGIGDIFIGILVVGGLVAEVESVVGVVAQRRTEQDVRHGVGLPLDAHLGIPAVGA